MKEMSLLEVQEVSLNILKDVHEFCESHQIRYSLAYGTLIGAIRHKGFIPWDDDVDIIIPRPDFERFCKEYQSENGYELYAPDGSRSFLTYARVCDNNRTLARTNCPWAPNQTGLWIDVFPLDGLPENEKDFMALVKTIRNIQTKIVRLRAGRYLNLSDTTNLRNFFACLTKKLLYIKYDIHTLLFQHIQLLRSNDYGHSEFCGQLCVMDYPEKEHNPVSDYDHYIKKPFCDSEFYVMNGYDNILRRYYGNYMELPPEDKRSRPQYVSYAFFWK